jgi:hypothetical protein
MVVSVNTPVCSEMGLEEIRTGFPCAAFDVASRVCAPAGPATDRSSTKAASEILFTMALSIGMLVRFADILFTSLVAGSR